MKIIVHRINKILNLKIITKKFGLEIDLRDFNKDLVLTTWPF
jgi:hypothetical protein